MNGPLIKQLLQSEFEARAIKMSKNIYMESCYNIEVNRYFVYTISSIETSTVSKLTPFTYFWGKQYRLRTSFKTASRTF